MGIVGNLTNKQTYLSDVAYGQQTVIVKKNKQNINYCQKYLYTINFKHLPLQSCTKVNKNPRKTIYYYLLKSHTQSTFQKWRRLND